MLEVFLLAVGMFSLGLDAYVLAGLLPTIGSEFHVSLAATGQIVTAFTLSYAILSPLLAVASAKFDRRRVLIAGLVVFAAANIASILSGSLWALIVARVVAGAAAGLYSPSAASTAVTLVAKERRGRALSIILGGLASATVFGVPLGLMLAQRFGWRSTLAVVATLALVAAVGVAFRLPRVETVTPGLRERVAVLGDRGVLARILVMLLAGTASLGTYTYLAPLLNSTAGIASASLPLYFFLWGAAGVVGNGLSGWLLDRGVKAHTLLTSGLGVLLIALASFPLVAKGPGGAVLVLVAWGISVWSLQVPLQHELARIAPDHTPTAIALLASSIYLGSAVGSGIGGFISNEAITKLGPIAAIAIFIALFVHLAATRLERNA
ncbi:MFS transporter [Burkholderia multivorans]|uniref:MFS transporter n=1 Tax=Burkholderia multivorans TaxID=87883 RepID=UPI001C2110CA|nr:MFS transporter [Burkholderia multivorans]MBU9477695.1 MFS transporter [Burkholderia multivorans]